MAKFCFALSDKLCREYLLFKGHSEEYDKSLVSKLLRYYTGKEFVYNHNQIDRIGIKVSSHLYDNISRQRDLRGKSVEELSEKSDFPYININDDSITTCLTGCFLQNDSRVKAVEHIKRLCAKAEDIVVYESTVYPGCTEEKCIPLLEEVSGLKYGEDFKVGYSPERINLLKAKMTGKNTKKLVKTKFNWEIEIKKLIDLYEGLILRKEKC